MIKFLSVQTLKKMYIKGKRNIYHVYSSISCKRKEWYIYIEFIHNIIVKNNFSKFLSVWL